MNFKIRGLMGWYVPVVIEESGAYTDEGEHEIEAEQMTFDQLSAAVCHSCTPWPADVYFSLPTEKMKRNSEPERPGQVQEVVDDDGKSYNEGL